MIWEQAVPNPTNNNTVLPSRSIRGLGSQRHYAPAATEVPHRVPLPLGTVTVHTTPLDNNGQTRIQLCPFSTDGPELDHSMVASSSLLRCLAGSSTFSILNAPWMKPRSITRNTIPRLFIVVCRTVGYLSSSFLRGCASFLS